MQSITDKLVHRHPHVFTPDGIPLADAPASMTANDVVEKWEDLKARERQQAAQAEKTILSGVLYPSVSTEPSEKDPSDSRVSPLRSVPKRARNVPPPSFTCSDVL